MSTSSHKRCLLTVLFAVLGSVTTSPAGIGPRDGYQEGIAETCPDFARYAATIHGPYSAGERHLPFQRPFEQCRTFQSSAVEKVIADITSRMLDKDLARLFENAFPNTLDSTVKWHTPDTVEEYVQNATKGRGKAWEGPQTFIVTGDITAEWLRDSTNQLKGYHRLATKDEALKKLILGAINTQSEYVIESPYCNAFQPPPASGLQPSTGHYDSVTPFYEINFVLECKYELDSLASFLALGNDLYNNTKSTEFVNDRWLSAVQEVLNVVDAQSLPTFDPETGDLKEQVYTFRRNTDIGTETLTLGGRGNPLNDGTGLVRSAFRPSDDSTILGYFIPGNAMMSVELRRTAEILSSTGNRQLADELKSRAERIEKGIWEHGVVHHKKYGDVFAYEVDGYGSQIIMDDANVPSLLALPRLGFVDKNDKTYQNTRRMILDVSGNPYSLKGKHLSGIGGPHTGLQNVWPISLLVQAMTSDDDQEIQRCLEQVVKSSKYGLIRESVSVNDLNSYSRSWFAWANSIFAQTIIDLAKRKPHVVFGPGAASYDLA